MNNFLRLLVFVPSYGVYSLDAFTSSITSESSSDDKMPPPLNLDIWILGSLSALLDRLVVYFVKAVSDLASLP